MYHWKFHWGLIWLSELFCISVNIISRSSPKRLEKGVFLYRIYEYKTSTFFILVIILFPLDGAGTNNFHNYACTDIYFLSNTTEK